jgi:hypothetical protein
MLTVFGAALIFDPKALGPPNREIRSCTIIVGHRTTLCGSTSTNTLGAYHGLWIDNTWDGEAATS